MPFLEPIHTASLFHPLHEELGGLLRSLEPAEWVTAFRRVGPPLLSGMLAVVGPQVAAFFQSLNPQGDDVIIDRVLRTRSVMVRDG